MKLKKILISCLFAFMVFLLFNVRVLAKEVNVYMFYGKTCSHCEEAYEYLKSIENKYDLNIYRYEVWYDEENQKLMKDVAKYLDVNVSGVPFTIIDNTAIFGYAKGVTDETYRYHIKQASKSNFVDKVGIKLGVVEESSFNNASSSNNNENDYNIKLPIIGKVNLKDFSLPILSVLMGIIDGFNPCALWVLLFLISTLIGMKDKKRLWVLGLVFLVSSALIYMAFMVSWLSFAKMISGVVLVRMIIALVALIGGAFNINKYVNQIGKTDGCTTVVQERRNIIFAKIKK